MSDKKRLDVLLTEQGLADTRSKAQEMIKQGLVYVSGVPVTKTGATFDTSAVLEIRGEVCPYVSRGGWKLEKALEVFGIEPKAYVCSDSGASTGGFTDCLLQHGASKVFAIDVGSDQLDRKLRNDPRVVVMEQTNIRYVTQEQLGESLDLSVVDVSFISLQLVLPTIKNLLKANGQVVCLIKPQFEAGKNRVGKKGVVRDKHVHKQVLDDFLLYVRTLGFTVCGLTHSPVKGPEGNIEFLGHLALGEGVGNVPDTEAVVTTAHQMLRG